MTDSSYLLVTVAIAVTAVTLVIARIIPDLAAVTIRQHLHPLTHHRRHIPHHQATHLRHSAMSEVQLKLRELGFFDGVIDGQLGPKTREAITNYQTLNGLTVSGRMDDSTLSSLGIVY